MQTEWRPWIDVLRGGLSWPGIVILWTGVWALLDRHAPGGTGVCKEVGLAVTGAVVMVWTRTLFSNAGMDSLDHEGTLVEMSSLLKQGRLQWRDKAAFFARSLLAIAGAILFWDGVFTLLDEHTWESTIPYNLSCAALGGAGMVWVMTSEDERMVKEAGGDGIDGPSGPASVRVALAGKLGGDITRLSQKQRAMFYAKALFCNVCSVLFWKGVEEIIEEAVPDSRWTGVGFFAVGIFVLRATERLSLNSGLEDGLSIAIEMRPTQDDQRSLRRGNESRRTSQTFGNGGLGRTDTPRHTLERWFADCCRPCAGTKSGESGESCPPWVMTAAELTGVVFAWTGIEWYVWDDDFIAETWVRDVLYIVLGLTILLTTGTFANLAGTISPMSVLRHVHHHNKHEETLPLLGSDDTTLVHPVSPSLTGESHHDFFPRKT